MKGRWRGWPGGELIEWRILHLRPGVEARTGLVVSSPGEASMGGFYAVFGTDVNTSSRKYLGRRPETGESASRKQFIVLICKDFLVFSGEWGIRLDVDQSGASDLIPPSGFECRRRFACVLDERSGARSPEATAGARRIFRRAVFEFYAARPPGALARRPRAFRRVVAGCSDA